MIYVFRFLGFLLIPIIVNGALRLRKQPKKAEPGKVYFPKFFVIFGLIVSSVFLFPMTVTAFLGTALWIPILFSVFSLLGIAFITAFVNCRIEYGEAGFTAKNFFGIRRKYTYDQVTSVKADMHETVVYAGKRKITVDAFAVGGREFIAFVKKQYRKCHNGKALPRVQKDRRDLFRGNVYDAGGFVFAYVTVTVVILALGVLMAHLIWLMPDTAENTVEMQVTFSSCDRVDSKQVFLSAAGDVYTIPYTDWEQLSHKEEIRKICDGETEVTVSVKPYTPKGEKDTHYGIAAIRSENACLLDFAEMNRLHREDFWPLIFFPIGFAVLWGAFVAASVVVGRNPEKYKKFVWLFFKKGYIVKK